MTPPAEGGRFPTTRVSAIAGASSADPVVRAGAMAALCAVYWRPCYVHLRLKWALPREEAEDLTQEFFARALEGGFFERFEPGRARFRTFLRGAVDHLAANRRRDAARLKRGGGAAHLPMDFAAAEVALVQGEATDDAEERFRQEWMRSLFERAVEALRAHAAEKGHAVRFRIFERADLEPAGGNDRPSYRDLAEEFDLPVSQVTNHLAWARREFRRLVLEQLRVLTTDEAEYRAEARELFGVDPA
ncbi:MAG: sigma factor [Gemmatimonadales bacterium]